MELLRDVIAKQSGRSFGKPPAMPGVISESKVPKDKQFLTCEKHGEHEVKYSQPMNGFRFVQSSCPKCVSEERKAIEELERAHAIAIKRNNRLRRLDWSGMSKRLINKTFDDYKATNEGQKKAKAACEAIAASIHKGGHTPSLIMNGGVGTGKTALCAAIIQDLTVPTRTGWKFDVGIIKTINLIRDLKSTWRNNSDETELNRIKFYTNLDLLIIDEIGVQYGSETEKMFVFDVIDGRYAAMKPTVIISNLGIDAIKETLGERVIDRLREDGGTLLSFDWESYRK